MNSDTFTEKYSKEDYVIETDLQFDELDIKNKKELQLKIGLGVVYITLLLMSLFLV
ncbi:MAG: hypothetical protein WAR79_05250 [Melioribacteraceae bacterium]